LPSSSTCLTSPSVVTSSSFSSPPSNYTICWCVTSKALMYFLTHLNAIFWI
jgi:hypothetical protein